jgi:hypothetical protein
MGSAAILYRSAKRMYFNSEKISVKQIRLYLSMLKKVA